MSAESTPPDLVELMRGLAEPASEQDWVEGLIASVTTYPEPDMDQARAAAEGLAEERG